MHLNQVYHYREGHQCLLASLQKLQREMTQDELDLAKSSVGAQQRTNIHFVSTSHSYAG